MSCGVPSAIKRVFTALQKAIREQVVLLINRLLHGSRPFRQKGSTMQTTKHGRGGFTLVEIMIVVAIIGLLAAMTIPIFIHARNTSQMDLCIDNLRQLDGSKQQWSLENGAVATTVPQGTDIQPYLGRGSGNLPFCPVDSNATFATSYLLQDCQTSPTCQIMTNHVLP